MLCDVLHCQIDAVDDRRLPSFNINLIELLIKHGLIGT